MARTYISSKIRLAHDVNLNLRGYLSYHVNIEYNLGARLANNAALCCLSTFVY